MREINNPESEKDSVTLKGRERDNSGRQREGQDIERERHTHTD